MIGLIFYLRCTLYYFIKVTRRNKIWDSVIYCWSDLTVIIFYHKLESQSYLNIFLDYKCLGVKLKREKKIRLVKSYFNYQPGAEGYGDMYLVVGSTYSEFLSLRSSLKKQGGRV